MISIQDFLIVSGVNVALIVVGHVLHMRWLDRHINATKPKKSQMTTGATP